MLTGMWIDKHWRGSISICLGFACMAAAFAVFFTWDSGTDLPQVPFLVGSGLCIFGLCVLTPANSAYYTKVVEYQGGAQGVFGGVRSVLMSAGKSAGPGVAGVALNLLDSGTGNWIVFLLCVPVLCFNILTFPFIGRVMSQLDQAMERLEGDDATSAAERRDLNSSLLQEFVTEDEEARRLEDA